MNNRHRAQASPGGRRGERCPDVRNTEDEGRWEDSPAGPSFLSPHKAG